MQLFSRSWIAQYSGGTAQSAVVSDAARFNARAVFVLCGASRPSASRPAEGLAMTIHIKPSLGKSILGKSTWIIGGGGGLGIKALMVAAIAAVGTVTWMTPSGPSDAQNQSAPAASPVVISEQATSRLNPTITPTQATLAAPAEQSTLLEAITPEEPAPVDGLRISSQSWRRGGLGSKALVTFTLRNGNEYAVKDIEIACAFARRDGSHLTDRTRMIHDTVNMKSRKTFARLHVGFVNINANKAKCALVAASHI
jgi:hypothetical protein